MTAYRTSQRGSLAALCLLAPTLAAAQQPDWAALEPETLEHFQRIVQMDTTDPPFAPPGGERPVVDYLEGVLEQGGHPGRDLRR